MRKTIQEIEQLVPAFKQNITNHPQIMEVIDHLSKTKGCKFASLFYSTEHEIGNYEILVGADYIVTCKNDVEKIQNADKTLFTPFQLQILDGILISTQKSITNPKVDNTYYTIEETNGKMKVHSKTGQVYIFGRKRKKNVLVSLKEFPITNSSPETIEKRRLSKILGLQRSEVRQFTVEPELKLISISGNGGLITCGNLEFTILKLMREIKGRILTAEEYDLVISTIGTMGNIGVQLSNQQISDIVKTIQKQSQKDFNLTKEQVDEMLERIENTIQDSSEASE